MLMNFDIKDFGWILVMSFRVEIMAFVVLIGRGFVPSVLFIVTLIWYKSQITLIVSFPPSSLKAM